MAFRNPFSSKKQSRDIVYDTFGNVNASWYSLKDNEDYAKAYQEIPEASAIINDKAKQFAKGIWKCKDIKTGDLIEDDPFLQILLKPNPLMSGSEFNESLYRDKEIFGNGYMSFLTFIEDDTPNPDNVAAIYNLNARYTFPQGTGKIYKQTELNQIIEKYIFRLKGQNYDFKTDTVCHISTGNIDFINNQYLVGQSPLKPLVWPLSNINAAYEARNVYITKRGAFGIFTNNAKGDFGVSPLDAKDKKEVQEGLNSKYGLKVGKWQFIVTNAALKFEPISISSKDLELYKEVREDAIAIANGYNYPPPLLSLEGTTFDNLKIAQTQLYENAILPDARQIAGEINRTVHAIDYGKEYFLDYSHVSALQVDKKTQAQRQAISIRTIIELNTAIQNGNIEYLEAVNTLASILSIDNSEAENLLSKKTKKNETE